MFVTREGNASSTPYKRTEGNEQQALFVKHCHNCHNCGLVKYCPVPVTNSKLWWETRQHMSESDSSG